MREIKFKAYIPDLDIILKDITLYGDGQMGCYEDDFVESLPDKYTYDPDMGGVLLIDDENDIFETILTPLYGEDWIWLEENQFIPMQFIGLKDKNYEEIYEGDIVKDEVRTYAIKWVKEYAGFKACRQLKSHEIDLPIHPSIKFEIIGNIHQNPELLSK